MRASGCEPLRYRNGSLEFRAFRGLPGVEPLRYRNRSLDFRRPALHSSLCTVILSPAAPWRDPGFPRSSLFLFIAKNLPCQHRSRFCHGLFKELTQMGVCPWAALSAADEWACLGHGCAGLDSPLRIVPGAVVGAVQDFCEAKCRQSSPPKQQLAVHYAGRRACAPYRLYCFQIKLQN